MQNWDFFYDTLWEEYPILAERGLIIQLWFELTMMVYEKSIFGNKIEDISLENDIAEIYFIMDKSKLHFIFHSISGDGSDIHRFVNKK